jgi:putative peptidoglycan lipid II flippase
MPTAEQEPRVADPAETTVVERASIKRIMAGVVPVTLATQVLSFVSSLALANVLGATTGTDAYFLGLSVPMITFGILQAALRLGAIPALTERQTRAPGSFSEASSELFTAVAVGAAITSVLTSAVAAFVLPLAVSGSSEHLADLTRTTVIALAPLGLLGGLVGVLGAILAARGSFLPAAAAFGLEPIAKTLFVLFLGHSWGATTLVVGNLVGSVLAVAMLWVVARRKGVFIRFVRRARTSLVNDILRLSVPLLVSQSVLQVNPLIDRSMAAGVSAGSVTELEMGLRLFLVPAGLVASTLVAPLAATWSAQLAEEGKQALSESVTTAIRAVAIIIPPLVVMGVLLKTQIITLLYAGGAYTATALHHTSDVFGLLLLGLPAQVLVVVLATLFIVRRDSVFPMKIAIANVVLNVILNLALRPSLGVSGIALSTTLTLSLLCAVYMGVAQRRWHVFDMDRLRAPLIRATISTVGIAAVGGAVLSASSFGSDRIGGIAATLTVGAAAAAVHATVYLVGDGRARLAVAARLRSLSPSSHG